MRMPFRTPFPAEGTIISQVAGIMLINIRRFKFQHPVRLFAPLTGGFIKLSRHQRQSPQHEHEEQLPNEGQWSRRRSNNTNMVDIILVDEEASSSSS